MAQVPATPTLLTPANGATGIAITPKLTWNTVATAVTYRVQLSTVSTFATMVADDSTLTVGADSLLTALANGTAYYWRVNAKNTYGSSAWSGARVFTTITLTPATPTLLVPANNATGIAITPKLTWNTVANAITYRVQVATVSTFATTVADDSTLTVGADSLATALANGTAYYWRVNAKNTYGSSAWSGSRVFTTVSLTPAIPTLLVPANNATGIAITPKLTWNTVANAITYRVQLSTVSTFATTVADDSTLTVGADSLLTALANATVYYWRVNAKNTYGSSAWSGTRVFTTIALTPATPALLLPANNAASVVVNPSLTWNTVANAVTYRVQVSTVNTFATTVVDDSTLTVGADSLLTALANGTAYYWRVNAKNTYGSSAWSGTRTFTTITLVPPAPALLVPANNATGIAVTPKLTWNMVANAVTYRAQVSTISTFATVVADDSTLTVGADSLIPALANSTVYYWRVNGKNANGTGPWSTMRTFTTIPLTPLAPVLLLPANNAVSIAITPKLTWTTVANVVTYRAQVSTISTFATVVADDSLLTAGADSVVTPLVNATVYYWRVNGSNSFGAGAWSTVRAFTTITLTPPAPTLLVPANRATGIAVTPKLTWNTVANAVTYRAQVSTISTFATVVADDSTLTVGGDSLITALANSTVYYWRVDGKNANGTGTWSTVRSFTTGAAVVPAAPTLATPANGDTTISKNPKLTWTTVANAVTYRVQVSTVSTFTVLVVNDSLLAAASDSLITALQAGTVYFWRASSTNANGTSAWSAVSNFKTATGSTGVIANNVHHSFVNAVGRGVLELYRVDGTRVLVIRNDGQMTTKDQMLGMATRQLAKGFYTYKLQLESHAMSMGKMIVR
jgi:hypothetical protein